MKKLISEVPTLALYSPNKVSVLAADASKYGLGGVLFQDEHPLAYCSSTLTNAQKNYAQIEKELLAIVTTCKHFHYHIYGKTVKVLT